MGYESSTGNRPGGRQINTDFQAWSKQNLLETYARCLNFRDCAGFAGVSRTTWSKRWYELGLASPKRRSVAGRSLHCRNRVYHAAVISDLHLGSKWANTEFLEKFVGECRRRDISVLLNCGDTIDGIMSWGSHEEERSLHSIREYELYAAEHYPRGFSRSYFIEGNHCNSLRRIGGKDYSFGARLAELREDLRFIPTRNKLNDVIEIKGGLRAYMHHGTKSCSDMKGRSREGKLKSKVTGLMAKGIDADVYLFGHCHRRIVFDFMGKLIVGVGTFQETTPYIQSKGNSNDVCGLILNYQKVGDRIVVVPEFVSPEDIEHG